MLQLVQKQFAKSFISEGAVFVCNKWDLIEDDPEKGAIADHIIEKLEENWPGVDSQSQVVKLSTKNAIKSQEYGIVSPQFKNFMDAVKLMISKTIKERLVNDCR